MSAERKRDERWMRRALALAARGEGRTRPNPPVGAVLVVRGRAVGEGYHARAGGPHAEIVALRRAGAAARGATLYVTLEPCCTAGRTGPCTEAVIRAGVKRVVAAVRDPNPRHNGRGLAALRRADVAVSEGCCAPAAERLIAPFAKWVTTGLPYVTLKMAATLDGRIADAAGRSRWISGPAARRTVGRMRRKADAIMVGRRTACLDDPSLRAPAAAAPGPWRLVVDSAGRVPARARVLADGAAQRTIMAVTGRCGPAAQRRYERAGATVWRVRAARGRVSLPALLRRCGRESFLRVLCEGGGELAHALVAGGLADELVWFVAPRVLGAEGAPALRGPGWPLAAAPAFTTAEVRRVGEDVMVRAVRR
ncbi:MAG: bifunctional diaminohydroxyphosphoribosylaminopyrimidine deaminase/5-amino-6-(5-phosphoribosylamino)uracil reductase RibD [Lentisphaerae bacterium]|nr:bifunctional diaminohydroxyphosphoribosylaminopyrimidine deaminase/5-amino-6-(5-phosphoribosylamino)uracil reductase RibD [Lentisphaerota bacterium]